MDDARFWQLIEDAREGSGPHIPSADPDRMRELLDPLSTKEVSEFGKHFYKRLCELNTWPLWGAGYVLNGGMGDDSFHYFRSWIIGKGQDAYRTALADPDGISEFAEDDCELDNELLEYVAVEICEERGAPDPRDADGGDISPDDEPSGEAWDEDSVHTQFPKSVIVARRIGNWE